jgi:tetratricopeptide (TPR) repeat protein
MRRRRRLPKDFNLTVTVLRNLAFLSQQELALRAGIPLTRLSKIERGITDISFSQLEELAAAIGHPATLVLEALSLVRHSRWAQSVGAGDGRGQAGPRSPAVEMERLLSDFQRLQAGSMCQVIQHAETALWTREHRRQAVKLWEQMEPWPAALRTVTVRESELFQIWSLAELLCEESIRVAGDNADRALERAELALAVAEGVAGAEGWKWRVRAYCSFHVSNAWRVKGELQPARKHCDTAKQLWEEGQPCDPGVLDEARVLELEATLLRAERKLEESLRLYQQALCLSPTRERPYLLLGKSRTLEHMEHYEEALNILTSAQEAIPAGELQLQFAARFNQAVLLCFLDRYTEAAERLPLLLKQVQQDGQELSRIRLIWLEGRIAKGLGQSGFALEAFAKVRKELASRKIRYDQALVTLELAEVLAEQGRPREVQKLTRELIPVFEDQGVHLEAARALRLFCEAAGKQILTAELARQLIRYLYRARHNPDLRFQASC